MIFLFEAICTIWLVSSVSFAVLAIVAKEDAEHPW